jgi:hypothetical protein
MRRREAAARTVAVRLKRPTRQEEPRRCESASSGASVSAGRWIASPSCSGLHASSGGAADVRSLRSVGSKDARVAAAAIRMRRRTTSRLSHLTDTRRCYERPFAPGPWPTPPGVTRTLPCIRAGGGTRTHGLAITNRLLYQLSYSGARPWYATSAPEGEGEHGWVASLDPAPIHERRALDNGVI